MKRVRFSLSFWSCVRCLQSVHRFWTVRWAWLHQWQWLTGCRLRPLEVWSCQSQGPWQNRHSPELCRSYSLPDKLGTQMVYSDFLTKIVEICGFSIKMYQVKLLCAAMWAFAKLYKFLDSAYMSFALMLSLCAQRIYWEVIEPARPVPPSIPPPSLVHV